MRTKYECTSVLVSLQNNCVNAFGGSNRLQTIDHETEAHTHIIIALISCTHICITTQNILTRILNHQTQTIINDFLFQNANFKLKTIQLSFILHLTFCVVRQKQNLSTQQLSKKQKCFKVTTIRKKKKKKYHDYCIDIDATAETAREALENRVRV